MAIPRTSRPAPRRQEFGSALSIRRTHALRDAAGGTLPDLSNGGAQIIGQNDFESIHSQDLGRLAAVHRQSASVRP